MPVRIPGRPPTSRHSPLSGRQPLSNHRPCQPDDQVGCPSSDLAHSLASYTPNSQLLLVLLSLCPSPYLSLSDTPDKTQATTARRSGRLPTFRPPPLTQWSPLSLILLSSSSTYSSPCGVRLDTTVATRTPRRPPAHKTSSIFSVPH